MATANGTGAAVRPNPQDKRSRAGDTDHRDAQPARRRLAPNVVCMFGDERPAVVNVRRPGRNPRNVIPISSRPRLMPGDLAELCGSCLRSNLGKRVRVLERESGMASPGAYFSVKSLFVPLDVGNIDTRKADGEQRMRAAVLATNLRRISNWDAFGRRL